ncbi:MAG: DMT family transporter [Candidatus Kerfeldbacteria bacterium]|nr:DMT family transporter [Candidatus Kerfeldbacteria bacterium]
MIWLFFALLAPALWAVTNIIDDRLVNKQHSTPLTLMIITGLFGGIPCMAILLFGHAQWPGWLTLALGLASGIIGLLVYLPYFYALKFSGPASDVLMWNLTPVLVTAFALIFLGDRLSIGQYMAVVLLIISSIVAGYTKGAHRGLSKAWHLMVLAATMSAVEILLQKMVFERTGFQTGLAICSFGLLLTALCFVVFSTHGRRAFQAHMSGSVWKLMTLNELLDVGAQVSRSFAISIGPLILVKTAEGTQSIFIILLELLLFKKTEKDPRQLFFAAILVIVGLVLIES